MTIYLYHHSQREEYRHPFGAVPCGSLVYLKLEVRGTGEAAIHCRLRLWLEGRGETLLDMEKSGTDGEEHIYTASFQAPETPGLIWYYFLVDGDEQRYYYGNQEDRLGGEGRAWAEEPPSYQMTVFSPTAVPAWWREGLVYQIFVDRFYRGESWEKGALSALSREENRQGPRRLLHLDWNDTPFYSKDEAGRVVRWPFFGGTLEGVRQKLPYLQNLGVTVLYLNPIFEAASNHKYDTADYLRIDPGYGDEEDFRRLVEEAASMGIFLILDGVFSHTGCDSVYFNRYGTYPQLGAFQSKESIYHDWFLRKEDGTYEYWWGVEDLPNVDEMSPAYQDFVWRREDSVIRHWLRAGAKGWRLDVADELPDEFIRGIRWAVKETDPDALLLGEVWEDASNKVSYGCLRGYLNGDELDATMNYPFRTAFIDYFLGRLSAEAVHRLMMSLHENYPRENFFGMMNLIGSHDRMRILTALGEAPEGLTEQAKERFRLSEEQRALAVRRLRLLVLLQMVFPGVPSIYYGDEAGLEGYEDPLNRRTFPWGQEDEEVRVCFRRAISLRREYKVLRMGAFRSFWSPAGLYGLERYDEQERVFIVVNPHVEEAQDLEILLSEKPEGVCLELLSGAVLSPSETPQGTLLHYCLAPLTAAVIYCQKTKRERKLPSGRQAGILCHITSLPSDWGVGDLGESSRFFIDFLADSGQSIWQILPLNSPGAGNSPFSAYSAFAGNELLLDLSDLMRQGLLTEKSLHRKKSKCEPGGRVDYQLAWKEKETFYRKAFRLFQREEPAYLAFCQAEEEWLEDYCLFRALLARFKGRRWQEWPAAIRNREEEALASYKEKLSEEIEYYRFLQYQFQRQWLALKAYAAEKGIAIWGDLPMYVAENSCDAWSRRELFCLDEHGEPIWEAGVPSDYFSAGGQRWGDPIYRWDEMAKDGYAWWQAKLRRVLQWVDKVRLDHFRGFESYWAIPAGKEIDEGSWWKGPGKRFFEVLEKELGPLPVFAEDLGHLTPEVSNLRNICGYPGVKVYQFSAEEMLQEELPETERHCVFYTGTHDNETLRGWYEQEIERSGGDLASSEASEERRRLACRPVIERLYATQAAWVVVPLQDVLGLGAEHRMNVPNVPEGNWAWRAERDMLTEEVASWLREAVKRS